MRVKSRRRNAIRKNRHKVLALKVKVAGRENRKYYLKTNCHPDRHKQYSRGGDYTDPPEGTMIPPDLESDE